MATAGYSGTPLLKKLGIKEETKVQLIHAPKNYFDLLEKNISAQLTAKKETPDLVHLFVQSKKELEKEMTKIKPFCKIKPAIIVWVSWYKKSVGIPTDITEDEIRRYALQHDWVDVKVCAVDEQWSGLKLVVPVSKR